MKLENILDKFLENKNNYIEFYENTVKRKKYFSIVFILVIISGLLGMMY